MTWDEVINNPFLKNLPFKIELNKFGQILMSPASNWHGMLQSDIGYEIRHVRKNGQVINECSIQTSDGVKVADVAWASDEFMAQYGKVTPFPHAPEICVEIVSPSNTKAEMEQKIELYLAKGAHEVWVVREDKTISFYTHIGEVEKSNLVPEIKL